MYRNLFCMAGLIGAAILLMIQPPSYGQDKLNITRANTAYQQACPICRQCPALHTSLVLQSDNRCPSLSQATIPFHNSHVEIAGQRYKEALNYILSASDQARRQGNDSLLYFTWLMNATVYQRSNLADKALLLLDAARKIGDSLHLPLLPQVYSDIAAIYFRQKKYQKALDYYQQLESHPDTKKDAALQRTIYNNMAITYLYLEQYPSAETYHFKSLAIEEALADSTGIATSYLNLGDLYFEQFQDDKAIEYLKKSLRMATLVHADDIRENALKNLSLAMESKHNYQAALDYHRQAAVLKDSIWNRDKVWELGQQEKAFAVSLKQKEVAGLQHQAQLQASEIKRKNWQRNAFIITAISLLAVCLLILYAFRQKIKSNKIIFSQKRELEELIHTKDKLFSVIAHDLRSPVITLQLLQQQVEREIIPAHSSISDGPIIKMKRELNNFQHLLDNLLQWVWIHSNRVHFHPEKLHLYSILQQVTYDFHTALQQKEIVLDTKISPDAFVMGDIESLKIIFRNIISNSIKHTFQGTININLVNSTGTCCVEIADTGTGIPESSQPHLFDLHKQHLSKGTAGEPSTGLGLWLCKYFAEKNNGNITISSVETKGTTVSVYLPSANPISC